MTRIYDELGDDGNWCPDCGLPRGVCDCATRRLYDGAEDDDEEWDCEERGHLWEDGPQGKTFECVVCGEAR